MSISVECSCGGKFKANDELAGKSVKCPACNSLIQVRDSSRSSSVERPSFQSEAPVIQVQTTLKRTAPRSGDVGSGRRNSNPTLILGIAVAGCLSVILLVGFIAYLFIRDGDEKASRSLEETNQSAASDARQAMLQKSKSKASTLETSALEATDKENDDKKTPVKTTVNDIDKELSSNKPLIGVWLVSEERGEAMRKNEVFYFDIGESKFGFNPPETPMTASYTVDYDAQPQKISIQFQPSHTVNGIFEIDGENLKICLSDAGTSDQPTKFDNDDGQLFPRNA